MKGMTEANRGASRFDYSFVFIQLHPYTLTHMPRRSFANIPSPSSEGFAIDIVGKKQQNVRTPRGRHAQVAYLLLWILREGRRYGWSGQGGWLSLMAIRMVSRRFLAVR